MFPFKSVTEAFFRGAVGAMLVYDISRRSTFDDLARWLALVRENCHESIGEFVVGRWVGESSVGLALFYLLRSWPVLPWLTNKWARRTTQVSINLASSRGGGRDRYLFMYVVVTLGKLFLACLWCAADRQVVMVWFSTRFAPPVAMPHNHVCIDLCVAAPRPIAPQKHVNGMKIALILVGNKSDMSSKQREVSMVEGLRFARKHGLDFMEVSDAYCTCCRQRAPLTGRSFFFSSPFSAFLPPFLSRPAPSCSLRGKHQIAASR